MRTKTENRNLYYSTIDEISGEVWKKENGGYDTYNKKYYVSNKGRRKVVYKITRKHLFDFKEKHYYNLIEHWEKLSNCRRKPHKWNCLDDYSFYGIVTPDYYSYMEEHGADEEELDSLIRKMYPNEFDD